MKPYIEQNCIIEHNGHKYESGGAVITDSYVIGYVGDVITECSYFHKSRNILTDWKGNKIGEIYLSSSWKINSAFSDRMYQAYAYIDGKTYTGRTMGKCMIFKGKRIAKELRNK